MIFQSNLTTKFGSAFCVGKWRGLRPRCPTSETECRKANGVNIPNKDFRLHNNTITSCSLQRVESKWSEERMRAWMTFQNVSYSQLIGGVSLQGLYITLRSLCCPLRRSFAVSSPAGGAIHTKGKDGARRVRQPWGNIHIYDIHKIFWISDLRLLLCILC